MIMMIKMMAKQIVHHPVPPLRLCIMLTSVFSVLDNDDEDEDVSDENCVSAQIVVKQIAYQGVSSHLCSVAAGLTML